MWCLDCFQSPHHPRCPKAPEPPVAFYCDKCGASVYEDELEDGDCYETPAGEIICGTCVYKMSTKEALQYLGCTIAGYGTLARRAG